MGHADGGAPEQRHHGMRERALLLRRVHLDVAAAARLDAPRDDVEAFARVRGVVEHARAVHEVEGLLGEGQGVDVALDEVDGVYARGAGQPALHGVHRRRHVDGEDPDARRGQGQDDLAVATPGVEQRAAAQVGHLDPEAGREHRPARGDVEAPGPVVVPDHGPLGREAVAGVGEPAREIGVVDGQRGVDAIPPFPVATGPMRFEDRARAGQRLGQEARYAVHDREDVALPAVQEAGHHAVRLALEGSGSKPAAAARTAQHLEEAELHRAPAPWGARMPRHTSIAASRE